MIRLSRRVFLALGGGAAAALLAACGAPPAPTSAPAKPTEAPKPAAEKPAQATTVPPQAPAAAAKAAGKEQITVRVHNRSGVEGDVIEVRAKEWNEANPGVVFKPEMFAGAEYFQKIQTLIAGNQIGDVAWAGNFNSSYQLWALKNITAPIDEFIKGDNFDSSPYFKEAWDGQIVNGKTYGLTFKGHPGSALLYFNKTLFEEARIPTPTDDTSLDALVENAKKLTAPDRWGYLIPITDAQHLPFMLRLFGTQVVAKDGKRSQIADPEALQALEFDRKLIFDLKASPDKSQLVGNPRDMFASGKIAMYKSGTWDLSVGQVIKDKFKWSVAVFPKGPQGNRGGLFTQDYMSVMTNSKNRREAWDIVKWLTDKRTGILLGLGGKPNTGNSGTAGGRKDVYESDELKNNPDYVPEVNAARYRALQQTAQWNIPTNARLNEIWDITNNHLARLFSGEAKEVKPFAQELNAAVQAVLDKPL